MKLVSAWLRIPFWQRVVAGFVLGAVAGWLMGPAAGTWLKPLGDLYVTLIKMIAVPLVFFAVINAVSSLLDTGDIRESQRAVVIVQLESRYARRVGLKTEHENIDH